MKKYLFSITMLLLPLLAAADEPRVGRQFDFDGALYMITSVDPYEASFGNGSGKACIDVSTVGTVKIPSSVTITYETYNPLTDQHEYKDYKFSITSIAYGAFMKCKGVTSVSIPNSVKSIGGSAFVRSGLTSVVIPNSVTLIEGMAFNLCEALASVTIGNSVKIIESSAFANCSSLKAIVIPNSVTTIENSAFYSCTSLTDVTIGSGVTSIGSWAFGNIGTNAGARNRASGAGITIRCLSATVPATDFYAFGDIDLATATLIVPEGSVEAYKADAVWQRFGQIIGSSDPACISVIKEETGPSAVYNLSGQRFTSPRKGLNIMEGKKVVIK